MRRDELIKIKEDLMKLIEGTLEEGIDKDRLIKTVDVYMDIHIKPKQKTLSKTRKKHGV